MVKISEAAPSHLETGKTGYFLTFFVAYREYVFVYRSHSIFMLLIYLQERLGYLEKGHMKKAL